MQATPNNWFMCLLGLSMLPALACSAPNDSEWAAHDTDEELSSFRAITGGWTPLTLSNGWQGYPGAAAPSVGVVNGVVTLRGALRGTNATSNVAFSIPEGFYSPDHLILRTTMGVSSGGMLWHRPDPQGQSLPTVAISQDGALEGTLSQAMMDFTSLDGVSFDDDVSDATPIPLAWGWACEYGFRFEGSGNASTNYAYADIVDGFVRLQGYLIPEVENETNTRLLTLPAQFRPSQTITLPVTRHCNGRPSYGHLTVYWNGDVHIAPGNGANQGLCRTSLEGTSYALSYTSLSLNLNNGWTAASPRAVKVRVSGGVVRFEGAITGGTSTIIATLPPSMRPSNTVRLVVAAQSGHQARLVVEPSGTLRLTGAPLSVTSGYTSLDGVSFGLD